MSEPFIGQLMLFPFGFAPKGWAQCNGQLMSIQQNQALFSLLGTTYGGDGRTTFALPDLRGRAAVGAGQGPGLGAYTLGERGGSEAVTLIVTQIPLHTHVWRATANGGSTNEANSGVLATASVYTNSPPDPAAGSMNQGQLGAVGGNMPHENRSPALTMNWCIALVGIFPSQN